MDTPNLKQEIDKQLAALDTLRDDLRVRIHLAGLDAKDAFEKLEHEVKTLKREATESARSAIASIAERFKSLADRHDSGKPST